MVAEISVGQAQRENAFFLPAEIKNKKQPSNSQLTL
jgi:hypothetical protein